MFCLACRLVSGCSDLLFPISPRPNSAIRKLNVRSNDIGAAGAMALAEALHGNENIEEFIIADNHVDRVGAAAIARSCNTLTVQQLLLAFGYHHASH